jgi:hypothetical protein
MGKKYFCALWQLSRALTFYGLKPIGLLGPIDLAILAKAGPQRLARIILIFILALGP